MFEQSSFGLYPSPYPSLMGAFSYRFAADLAEGYRRQWASMAKQPCTPEMVAILRQGSCWISDYQNAASGYGEAVHVLLAKGFLTAGPRTVDQGGMYKITDAGRAEVERHRIADLAAMGVHEIDR